MKINGEEVELVTSFDQLRAGMIVWVKPCGNCYGQHRIIMIRAGVYLEHPVFYATPMPKCADSKRQEGCAISKTAIRRGVVYRVIDPQIKARTIERVQEKVRP